MLWKSQQSSLLQWHYSGVVLCTAPYLFSLLKPPPLSLCVVVFAGGEGGGVRAREAVLLRQAGDHQGVPGQGLLPLRQVRSPPAFMWRSTFSIHVL